MTDQQMQDSVFRNVENMLRIALLAYAQGERDVFASQIVMAAQLVNSVWKSEDDDG